MFHEAGMLNWEIKLATFYDSWLPVQNETIPNMLMLWKCVFLKMYSRLCHVPHSMLVSFRTCSFENVFVPAQCS